MSARRKYDPQPGDRFGRGTVTAVARVPGTRPTLTLHCDCGNDYTSWLNNVCNGNTQSCGCYNKAKTAASNKQRAKFASAAECNQAWRDSNTERLKEYARQYRADNADKRAEWYRSWAARNPESRRITRRNGRAKRRAKQRQVPSGSYTRSQVLERYGSWCCLCFKTITDDTWWVDHLIPIKLGGWDVMDNLRPTHAWCNRQKSSKIIPLLASIILSELDGPRFRLSP